MNTKAIVICHISRLNLSPLLYFSRPTLSVWFNIFSVHHVLQYNSGVLYQLYIVHQAHEWHKKAKGKRLRNAHTLSIDTSKFFLLSEIGDISKQWLLFKDTFPHLNLCWRPVHLYWMQQHPRIVNFNFL